jgi:hypothetical protein
LTGWEICREEEACEEEACDTITFIMEPIIGSQLSTLIITFLAVRRRLSSGTALSTVD